MKVTPLDLVLPSEADEAGSDRNQGLHISGLIKHLLVQMDPKRYSGTPDDATRILWELGLGWEDIALSRAFWERVLRRTYPSMSFKQVQAEKDGVWGTCDMISLMRRTTITESKLTQISMDNDIAGMKFWSWRVQMMAYCEMWDARHAILPVCFLNGDYKPRRIVPRAWSFEFDKQELRDNWAMLMQAKQEILDSQKEKKR